MKVVSVVGYKGGTAKTTVAVNLADVLGERVPTVLIDTDRQASARAWLGSAEHVRVELVPAPEDLERVLAQSWRGVVVIDGRPNDPNLTETLMRHSDLVLVPLRPSALDLHANLPILERLADSARGMAVITMAAPRTRDAEMIRQVLEERHRVRVADTVIGNRVIYARAPMWQKSVCDAEPGGAAAAEILALAGEISAVIGL